MTSKVERRRPSLQQWAKNALRSMRSWKPVSHPHKEEFLAEQYRATRGVWRAALIVGTIVFAIRGVMDWKTGMASPNIWDEVVWRLLGTSIQIGLIMALTPQTTPSRGQKIVAAFLITLSIGLVGNVFLNSVRSPYSLLPITFICMVASALWLRAEGLFWTLLFCLIPVVFLMGSGVVAPIDIKSYGLYIPLAIILGLILRKGRLGTAFDAFLLRKHLAAQALHDPLTGILNRAGWRDQLTASMKWGVPVCPSSLLFFDLDKFKLINDTHGHPMGDKLICATAARIQNMLRGSDILARFGGEEFVVFLPGADLENATIIAERIREDISSHHDPVPVTVSIGVCEFRPQETIEEALERADRALLSAKQSGRNRVTVAS